MEQLTYLANGRLLALSDAATPALVQGPASGDIRFQTGAATVVPLSPGLNVEFTVGGAFSSGGRTQSLNGGTPIETGLAAAGVSALHFGSDNAGNSAPVIRFKRVLLIGRALTSTERAGINGWAAA